MQSLLFLMTSKLLCFLILGFSLDTHVYRIFSLFPSYWDLQIYSVDLFLWIIMTNFIS